MPRKDVSASSATKKKINASPSPVVVGSGDNIASSVIVTAGGSGSAANVMPTEDREAGKKMTNATSRVKSPKTHASLSPVSGDMMIASTALDASITTPVQPLIAKPKKQKVEMLEAGQSNATITTENNSAGIAASASPQSHSTKPKSKKPAIPMSLDDANKLEPTTAMSSSSPVGKRLRFDSVDAEFLVGEQKKRWSGITDLTTPVADSAKLILKRRDEAMKDLGQLREEMGSRPIQPVSSSGKESSTEKQRQQRSNWNILLNEMQWMSTDFAEERIFKQTLAKRLATSAFEYRTLRRRKTPAASAIEEFWNTYGGQLDGRPLPAAIATTTMIAPAKISSADRSEFFCVFPPGLVEKCQAARNMPKLSDRVDTALELCKEALADTVGPALRANHSHFVGILSPNQHMALIRIAVLGECGLGGILCDSERADHGTTLVALLECLLSDRGVSGPHLFICRDPLKAAFVRGIIAMRSPRLRVVSDATIRTPSELSSNDVMVYCATGPLALEFLGSVNWGVVASFVSVSMTTLLSVSAGSGFDDQLSQSLSNLGGAGGCTNVSHLLSAGDRVILSRWSEHPILVFDDIDPKVVAETLLSHRISSSGIGGEKSDAAKHSSSSEAGSEDEASSSTAPGEKKNEWDPQLFAKLICSGQPVFSKKVETVVTELLVPCAETEAQKKARIRANGVLQQLELACIYASGPLSMLHSQSFGDAVVPPPKFIHSATLNPEEFDGFDDRPVTSGKFAAALNLIRSRRVRRAIVLSSKASVLDAFAAFAIPRLYPTCEFQRCDRGSVDARVAAVLRFTDSEWGVLVGRPADLFPLKIPTADSCILLDCFASDKDVAAIRAVACPGLIAYRLYTRGTLEQTALESSQHPGIIGVSVTSTPGGSGQGGVGSGNVVSHSASGSGSNASNNVAAGATSNAFAATPTVLCELRVVIRSFELNAGDDEMNGVIPVSFASASSGEGASSVANPPSRALRDYAREFAWGTSGSCATRILGDRRRRSGDMARSPSLAAASSASLFYDIPSSINAVDYFDVLNAVVPPVPQKDCPRYVISFTSRAEKEGSSHRSGSIAENGVVGSMATLSTAGTGLGGTVQTKRKARAEEIASATAAAAVAAAATSPPAMTSQHASNFLNGDSIPLSKQEDSSVNRIMDIFGPNYMLTANILNNTRLFRGDSAPPRSSKQIQRHWQSHGVQPSRAVGHDDGEDDDVAVEDVVLMPASSSLSFENTRDVVSTHFGFWVARENLTSHRVAVNEALKRSAAQNQRGDLFSSLAVSSNAYVGGPKKYLESVMQSGVGPSSTGPSQAFASSSIPAITPSAPVPFSTSTASNATPAPPNAAV